MQYLVYAGVALAVIGMLGLGYCIKTAASLRKEANEGHDIKDRMGTLVAVNTASVVIAFIGLGMVIVGRLLG